MEKEREPVHEKINVHEIFENAMRDPSLFSTVNIQNILDSIENDKNDYLENKTMDNVINDIYEKFDEIGLPIETQKVLCDKLIGYRYVDEIHELFKGKHIRWMRIKNLDKNEIILTNGGIVVNVKFLDNGMQVLCKNSQHRFMQYKFDECLTFQKLSTEEQLLLMAYENMKK